MDQTSNVQNRADKLYKSSREKFWYLLREVVSNSIHALIIRQNNESDDFKPEVKVDIAYTDTEVVIEVTDNGDGFTKSNAEFFSRLDERNPEKEALKFHPMGQGRLAIVFFSDNATYRSTFRDETGRLWKKEFPYPEQTNSLFSVENFAQEESGELAPGTVVAMRIYKQATYSRAKTFFTKYDSGEKIKYWFIETFFPFIVNNPKLTINIDYNGDNQSIDRTSLEKNIVSIPVMVDLTDSEGNVVAHSFKIWLIKSVSAPKSKNEIFCFARNLRASLEDGKLEYSIDLPEGLEWYLTSEFFDLNVDQKGDKIELTQLELNRISDSVQKSLDEHFKSQIFLNRSKTNKNVDSVRNRFHSLAPFIDTGKAKEKNVILTENDIVTLAVESKGQVEKKFWNSNGESPEDSEKLLNSSLQIYIAHRSRVLATLQTLIRKFDEQGDNKNELEDEVHDLLFKRGKSLRTSENINHLHNLWILDDKFTIFSETMQAKSTINGQSQSDVYFWIDDPDKVKEVLILELKSTTSAHNAGNKGEGMVAQVKRYATSFYRDPVKVLNWDVDTSKVLYNAIILARKSDIYKELNSNNVAGNHIKIPFLEASYYFNETFSVSSSTEVPRSERIRIEMYSYEDISEIAQSRNKVFFNLLKNEFKIDATAESEEENVESV